MYRLVVVAGPGRGTKFKLGMGENTIGRQLGNTVVLPSSQVSKKHCVLVASNGKVIVQDNGSANGTFVNGMMAKTKALQPGDRIGVGEYILELIGKKQEALPQVIAPVVALPVKAPKVAATPAPIVISAEELSGGEMPKDLVGKGLWMFESYVMPFFYSMNLKQEWRTVCLTIFGGFLLINLLISVQPLLQLNTDTILRESKRRAAYIAGDIADRNTAALSQGLDTHTEIGRPEKAEGVTLAVLTDLDLRVIAPSARMGQYLTSGNEVRFAKAAATKFRAGQETGLRYSYGNAVVAIEPVKTFKGGKNITIAMSIVAIDATLAMMGSGEMGVVYSQTLIISGLVGLLMLAIMYRLTLKPFLLLNEDMDKALKGNIPQVTHEFRMEELNPLWDLINSSLQRIPRSSSEGQGPEAVTEVNPAQFIGPIKTLAEQMGLGVAICGADRRVCFVNDNFTNDTGIRSDVAIGNEFSSLGTDESLGKIVQDLFDQCTPGGESTSAETEFSGVQYKLLASAFGSTEDSAVKAYVLTTIRKAE